MEPKRLHRRWPALIKTDLGMAEGAVVEVAEREVLLATDVRLDAGRTSDASVELPKQQRRVLLRLVPADPGHRRRDVRGWAHRARWTLAEPDRRRWIQEEIARDGAETREGGARPRFHLVEMPLETLAAELRRQGDRLVAVVPDRPALRRGDVLHVRVLAPGGPFRIKGRVGRRSRRRPVMELLVEGVFAAQLVEALRRAA